MKTKLSCLIVCLFSCNFIYAQCANWLWAKRMGGTSNDYGTSVAVDGSGNVYTTGYFFGTVDFDPGPGTFYLTSAGAEDIFISKLDASGNFIWAKRMGGANEDFSFSITIDISGNVYTTGDFNGIADFDPGAGTFNLTAFGGYSNIFISKLDSSGNFVWAKKMGGSGHAYSFSIVADASGNLYTTGSFIGTDDFDPGFGIYNLTSHGLGDIFVSKLDSSGNFIWAKAMGGTGWDYGNCIALDASDNIYITGSFEKTVDFDPGVGIFNLTWDGDISLFVSKLDSSGNFVWAKAMSGLYSGAYGYSLALDATDNVYTTGGFGGTIDFDPGAGVFNLTSVGNADIFISKLDTLGNFVWAKDIGGVNDDIGNSIAIDRFGSGDVYTTGYFQATADFDPGPGTFNLFAGGIDMFISKLNASGNFLGAQAIGPAGEVKAQSIAVDAFGNVYVAGSFNSNSITFGSNNLTNAGARDVFIAKFNSYGMSDVAITSSPTTGCLPNTIYIGYGAQSITLTASATGAVSYLWSTGETIQSISVSSAGTYSVTAFDASGCVSAQTPGSQININVIDAHCGNDGKKITLCHVPPGNSGNPQTICIAPSAVAAHLALHSGDCIGECPANNRIKEDVYPENEISIEPNPARDELRVTGYTLSEKGAVEIYDVLGQRIFSQQPAANSQQLVIDVSSLPDGVYFLQLKTQGAALSQKLVINR
jgi:hypothetical protein